jgi:DNA-binding IclR family transcriptional regulator
MPVPAGGFATPAGFVVPAHVVTVAHVIVIALNAAADVDRPARRLLGPMPPPGRAAGTLRTSRVLSKRAEISVCSRRVPLTPSPSVLRAGEILEFLARNAPTPFSVSDIARAVGHPRASCDSVLLALAEQGLVLRSERSLRYTLGPVCAVLGDAVGGEHGIVAARGPAQELARSTGSFVAVVTCRGRETRVAEVFDHGPPFGFKASVGQTIPLVPPFGAVFVAWAGEAGVDEWLRAPTVSISEQEEARYRAAVHAVRDRGYSVSVLVMSEKLQSTIETFSAEADAVDVLRRRDELMREIVHTEYLPTTIEAGASIRVSQMSAPVFDRNGAVSTAIMMLGPPYEVTAAEIGALGTLLRNATERATARLAGAPPSAA